MTVVAVSMFHNEEDLAEYVVRHMLAECDRVIVADNRSTDRTRTILEGIGDPRLTVVDEPNFAYRQAETMMRLVGMAEADWIVPFDADEWWDSAEGRIADVLARLPDEVTAAQTWDMIPQPSDDSDPDPFRRIVWMRPGSLWSQDITRKIAFRPGPGRVLMQGNHGLVGEPFPPVGPLRIRHYPFRSFEQAAAKLRHGRAAVEAGAPVGSGTHWREWGSYDDADLRAWWKRWTDPQGLERWAA